jgi:Phosphoesterase family
MGQRPQGTGFAVELRQVQVREVEVEEPLIDRQQSNRLAPQYLTEKHVVANPPTEAQWTAKDFALIDSVPATTGEGSSALGFYNVQQGDVPYFKSLADTYAMSDNFHQSVNGGTGANHIMLGTAT